MARPRREMRNGTIKCEGQCGRWLHPSSFSPKDRRSTAPNGVRLHGKCKACRQSEVNDAKNQDRAAAIVEGRARVVGRKYGVSLEFVMDDLNYESLIVPVRAFGFWSDEMSCCNCGHLFLNERDLQFDHIQPPRHDLPNPDWARLHARNIQLLCASCNKGKGDKTHADWLDAEEEKRLSVAAMYGYGNAEPVRPPADQTSVAQQPSLF